MLALANMNILLNNVLICISTFTETIIKSKVISVNIGIVLYYHNGPELTLTNNEQ